MTSRREFMASAGAVVAVSALPAMAAPYGWTTPPNWFDKPMRWAQMVFTEDDPGNYDPKFWLDYFKRTHSDAACLAGGGYMAFYPTKVPCITRASFSAIAIRLATS